MRCRWHAAFLVTLSFAPVVFCADPSTTSTSIVSHIPRQHVESTAIAAVGYSKRRHMLEIEFVNGAIYRYFDVPAAVYRELMVADSKARFYDFNIKGHYRSIPIRPPQNQQVPTKSPASAQNYGASGRE